MLEIAQLLAKIPLLIDIDPSAETVSVGFWFNHGSRDEGPGEFGYAHFVEHMIFKGTVARSAAGIAREIDRVGGNLNGFTEKELTCYYCTLPYESLDLAVDVLSDMAFSSVFDPHEIEKEKDVVCNEILSGLDSPDELAFDAYYSQLWPGNPLSLSITGDTKSISAITRESIHAFYRERYQPAQLIIAVAGNFSKAELIGILTRRLAVESGPQFALTRKKPLYHRFTRHIPDKFNQVQIYLGRPTVPSRKVEGLYNEMVFSTALGESMSSKLFQRLREELGLCYSISCFWNHFADVSLWSIFTSTQNNQVHDLIVNINKLLKELKKEQFSEEEVTEAKSHLKGSLIMAKADMESRMKRMVHLYSVLGTVFDIQTSMDKIAGVTREEVNNVVSELLVADSFSLLAYGNKKVKNFSRLGFDF